MLISLSDLLSKYRVNNWNKHTTSQNFNKVNLSGLEGQERPNSIQLVYLYLKLLCVNLRSFK